MNIYRIIALVSAIAMALNGCAGTQDNVRTDAARIEKSNNRLGGEVGRVTAVATQAELTTFSNGVFVGRSTVRIDEEKKLPAVFSGETWFNKSVVDLREFAQRITAQTNIPASISPDAYTASLALERTMPGAAGIGAAAMPGLPAVPGTMGFNGAGSGNPGLKQIRFSYNGSLRGLLDTASARFGVSWRYQNGEIQFYLLDTKTYSVRAVPGSSKIDASVVSSAKGVDGTSSSGTSGSTGGSGSQSTTVSSDLSIWTALDGAIKTMLSAKGKVIVSPSTSSVTATDTPEVLKRVSEYIEMQNVMLSKQVMITVQVLQVSRSNNEDYSIKWDLVYADLARKYGLQNVVAGANGASQLTFGIIKPTSKWNGSTAMISALSTQGTVNLETSASVVALNNQPAPIQTGKQTVYLASSNTTQTTNAGTTTSLTPGTVSTGFSMHVLPSIMLDGTILLQFSADISTLRTIREVVGGDTKIEAPEVDAKSFLQRAKMKSGETLVLSGFEQTDGNLKNSGVGTASNWLAGGGMKAARSKDSLVILVTPVIVGS